MRVLEVTIKNWAKYNPRSDVKSCAWFRMSNDFFSDPDFYGASMEARVAFVFIMCIASKKMSQTVKINTQMMADSMRVRCESVDFAIDELLKIGCIAAPDATVISIRSNPVESEKLHEVSLRYERTNERNERTNEPARETRLTPDHIVDLWNEHMVPPFEPASSLGRRKHLQNCLDSLELFKTREEWVQLWDRVKASKFLLGESGAKWRPSIVWLVDPDNLIKVQNGAFENSDDLSHLFSGIA